MKVKEESEWKSWLKAQHSENRQRSWGAAMKKKKMLTPWKKSYNQPRKHIEKQRCYFAKKVFPVVMYGCENWTIKKAEHPRIDGFELWCWRRLLRVFWTSRRSSQSILKEMSPEYSLVGWCWSWNSNTLATWCEELTHLKSPWCWKNWGQEKKGMTENVMVGWRIWVLANSGSWSWTGRPGMLQSMGLQSRTWLRDWTELR